MADRNLAMDEGTLLTAGFTFETTDVSNTGTERNASTSNPRSVQRSSSREAPLCAALSSLPLTRESGRWCSLLPGACSASKPP